MKHIIINRPELQSPLQRVTTRSITFIFWVVWIYLWLPLISLLAWWVGIQLFREHMLDNNGYQALLIDLHAYALTIVAIIVVMIGWARYNFLRFRDKEHRKTTMHVDLATQAQAFKLDPEYLRHWQQAQRLVIYHDLQGDIAAVAVDTTKDGTPNQFAIP